MVNPTAFESQLADWLVASQSPESAEGAMVRQTCYDIAKRYPDRLRSCLEDAAAMDLRHRDALRKLASGEAVYCPMMVYPADIAVQELFFRRRFVELVLSGSGVEVSWSQVKQEAFEHLAAVRSVLNE